MSESASVSLPDGTICVLTVETESDDRSPRLMFVKDGQTLEIAGEKAVYNMLKLVTAMPWGRTEL